MTKQDIEARIQKLTEEKAHSTQMILLLDGAIQDCEYWLEQMKAQNAVPEGSAQETKQ